MSFSHISHASMKTLVAGIAAAATLCTGAIATMQTANAADASTAPSVAGHAYNDLPVGNPDVTVTQIDNSALPATLRNPHRAERRNQYPQRLVAKLLFRRRIHP